MTYDDLITSLRDALIHKEGKARSLAIREKYSTALIDEFQDTDPAQYRSFEPSSSQRIIAFLYR